MSYSYPYPRPAVTVDLIALNVPQSGTPRVLLIERSRPPYEGHWALPGGFLDMDEELEVAARRELVEETGVELAGKLLQVGTFGALGRDPRDRTISVAFAAILLGDAPAAVGGDDARRASWRSLSRLPKLAFDHRIVLATARERLGQEARRRDGQLLELMPRTFTLGELHAVHAAFDADAPSRASLARRLRGVLRSAGGARRGRELLYENGKRR